MLDRPARPVLLRSSVLAWLALLPACHDAPPATPDATTPDAAPADAPPIDGAPKFCDAETRDDTYTPGMVKLGANGYEFELVSSTPGPPRKGNNAWVLQLRHPAPLDGLHLRVVPFMPDHGHGTAVQAVVTPAGNGTYDVSPVNLFMTGFWSVGIDALDPAAGDAVLDHVAFLFCVNAT